MLLKVFTFTPDLFHIFCRWQSTDAWKCFAEPGGSLLTLCNLETLRKTYHPLYLKLGQEVGNAIYGRILRQTVLRDTNERTILRLLRMLTNLALIHGMTRVINEEKWDAWRVSMNFKYVNHIICVPLY